VAGRGVGSPGLVESVPPFERVCLEDPFLSKPFRSPRLRCLPAVRLDPLHGAKFLHKYTIYSQKAVAQTFEGAPKMGSCKSSTFFAILMSQEAKFDPASARERNRKGDSAIGGR